MPCRIPLVRCILQVPIPTPISKWEACSDWHRPAYLTHAPHTIILIHRWTVIVSRGFGRKWSSHLWDIWTLRGRLWWGRFGIIFYWVRSTLLLILIWHIVFCLWHYHSQRGFNSAISGETYLFLLSCLIAFLWCSLFFLPLLLHIIWCYHLREHKNYMLLGILVSLMAALVVKLQEFFRLKHFKDILISWECYLDYVALTTKYVE